MLDPRVSRWFSRDPLEAKYPDLSTYVADNPIIFIDPNGKEIIGEGKADAEKFHNNLNSVFSGDKFANVRDIFKRGKKNKSKTFSKISDEQVKTAIEGLNQEEAMLVNEYVNTINSDKEHVVKYIEAKTTGTFSTKDMERLEPVFKENSMAAASIIKDRNTYDVNGDLVEGEKRIYTEALKLVFGGGLNIKTKKGSYSYIHEGARNIDVISGHEVIGHAPATTREKTPKENNTRAIRIENLIRKVMGKTDFRDGTNHGDLEPVENPQALPEKL